MVVLEQKSGNTLRAEERQVADALAELSQPYVMASLSQVERGRVSTEQASLVVGSIPFMHAALRQLGIAPKPEQTYPGVLSHLMHRTHRQTTLKAALALYEARGVPIFIKPSVRTKRFTGLVLDMSTQWQLQGVSRNEPVWLVDCVRFATEWRLYVDQGAIVHQACYAGDKALGVDLSVVQEAVNLLNQVPGQPKTYAIDFGVLNTGITALIELNQAYSVGAYDMDNHVLLKFLQSGWNELIRT
jgi:hypothetical protein